MHSFTQRKLFAVTSLVLCLFFCSASPGEPVNLEQVRKTANTFLKSQHVPQKKQIGLSSVAREYTASGLKEIRGDDETVLAYIIELGPSGFIATSADTDIRPIIAYSFRGSFPAEGDRKNPLYRLLKEDMRLRAMALAKYDESKKIENNKLWNLYDNEDAVQSASDIFVQWPQENTTPTGGWVETAWDQDSPYNNFCPLDPVDANRSVVGCVATAMAQVVNYHRQCNVHFNERDSYTTYSGIDIDADCNMYDFPSFDELNEYLAELRLKYSRQMEPNDTDVAALSFACGVASIMDYSSEGSGAPP